MRIVSLNLWGGKLLDPLLVFLREESESTDVFCFQEVFSSPNSHVIDGSVTDLFTRISVLLPDFVGFFSPAVDGVVYDVSPEHPVSYGLAMFVRKSLLIKTHGDFLLYGTRNWELRDGRTHPRTAQYLLLSQSDVAGSSRELLVLNVHGLYTGKGKDDTSDRVVQSSRIIDFVHSRRAVICGDFNLTPQTKSIAMLGAEFRNLIAEHGILSTRSALYKKPERFADYIFVSHDLHVASFAVREVVVSDHLPVVVDVS